MSEQQHLDQTIRRQVHLENLKAHEVKQFKSVLKKLGQQISYHLINDELVEMTQKDFDQVLKLMHAELSETLTEYSSGFRESLSELVVDNYAYEAKSLNNAYDLVDVDPVITTNIANRALRTPLSAKGLEGSVADEMLDYFVASQVKRLTNVVRQGRHERLTNAQINQSIRGTKKSQYKDGALYVTERQTKSLSKTLLQHAAQQAKSEVARRNSDIIIGEKVVATLDGKTSSICRALDGRVLKKGKRPPFHRECRSTTIFELDDKYKPKGKSKRASMNGVVEDQTYYEWLKKQPKEFQDDVLGKKRAILFRDGGLTPNQFARLQLDKNFNPLSLDEIREREPMAFASLAKLVVDDRYDVDSEHWDKLSLLWNNKKAANHLKENPDILTRGRKLGLTDTETLSFTGYSDRHGFIQSYLRNTPKFIENNPILHKNIKSNIDFMESGLRKLPDYKGKVVRRTDRLPHILALEKGDTFSDSAFLSTTYDDKIDVFPQRPVRLIMDVKTGKKIDEVSIKPQQKEVLMLPNTEFEVTKVEEKNGELWISMVEK